MSAVWSIYIFSNAKVAILQPVAQRLCCFYSSWILLVRGGGDTSRCPTLHFLKTQKIEECKRHNASSKQDANLLKNTHTLFLAEFSCNLGITFIGLQSSFAPTGAFQQFPVEMMGGVAKYLLNKFLFSQKLLLKRSFARSSPH